jgi:hypothetical protein
MPLRFPLNPEIYPPRNLRFDDERWRRAPAINYITYSLKSRVMEPEKANLNCNSWPFSFNQHFHVPNSNIGALLCGLDRALQYPGLFVHGIGLLLDSIKGFSGIPNTKYADNCQCDSQGEGEIVNPIPTYRHGDRFGDTYGLFCIFGGLIVTIFCAGLAGDCYADGKRAWGRILLGLSLTIGFLLVTSAYIRCLPWNWHGCLQDGKEHGQDYYFHGRDIVTQNLTNLLLTSHNYCITVISIRRGTLMANVLDKDKQVTIIGALAEGSGIRSIERMTGVHRDTVMRLGVKVGQECATMLDWKMRNLSCQNIQVDELWGFIGKKERHVRPDDDPQYGDVWTFCAIDAETKLVPSFKVGKRNAATANAFVSDVASRLKNRVQLSSDALKAYVEAVELAFGADVDYAQIMSV